jgi:ATP phosphoribosyltransferase
MLNIALPKGRLGEKVYKFLSDIGYKCDEYDESSRKLVFTDKKNGVSYFWVKPADVAIYVELGAADVGVVGKDIIEESSPDVYELADLGLGKCRMCVAAKDNWYDDFSKPLRVATKFVNTAKRYYEQVGRDIEVIKLNGSIELAPILGMSDVIVDIVETGTTLKENNLKVYETISQISARLIANRASYKFKNEDILSLTKKLEGAINNG